MNGFDPAEVQATRILRIPPEVESFCKRQKEFKEDRWPSYARGKRFFEKLGAQFRTVGGKQEMLLEDIVYGVEEFGPGGICQLRSIGFKAIEELSKDPVLQGLEYDDEDVWPGPEIHIITALGMCLARCQLIEHYIANSFLLGISKKQKSKYRTINDLREGWKRKTLGDMLRSIEEAWQIHPLAKANFELFLAGRNKLVHGLTTSERYDIRTRWGQLELWAFLNFFDVHSRIVKRAFRASYYASIEVAVSEWGCPKEGLKNFLTKKQREEAGIFFEFFSPKEDAI